MAWVATGVAVAGMALSVYSGSQAASSAAKQASAVSNMENEAIAKQNMNQMVRNSYRTGMLNMQLGLQKKQAVQQGFDTSVQFHTIKGQVVTNKEAAGAVGASADVVLTDLEMQYENSKIVQQENFASVLDNYNNELDAMRMNALNEVVDARRYQYNGPSSGQIIGSALVGAAINAAGSYAMRNMSLGLGPSPATQVQSTTGTMTGFRTDPFGPAPTRFGF